MRIKLCIATIVSPLLVLLSACQGSKDQTTAAYSLIKLSKGDISTAVSTTGTLNAVITVQVGSQVSGAISKMNVDFNSRVKKGEVIAQIEPAVFQAKLAEAEANLISAEADFEKAKVAVEDTKIQLARQDQLAKKKLVADSAVDVAKFAYKSAVVEAKVKEAAIARSKAIRDREKVSLEYTTIVAPIDGVVVSRDVDVGQTVAASLQAPTLFTIAQDLTQMQIETEVDESFIGLVQNDQRVSFTVFAYQKRVFTGKVSQIRLKPKTEAGVVKYNCVVRVENKDLALKPGMTATVTIEIANKTDVFKVPNSALRFVPKVAKDKEQEVRRALKKNPNKGVVWTEVSGELKWILVETGIVAENETEIIANELKVDMAIAVPQRRDRGGQQRGGNRMRMF